MPPAHLVGRQEMEVEAGNIEVATHKRRAPKPYQQALLLVVLQDLLQQHTQAHVPHNTEVGQRGSNTQVKGCVAPGETLFPRRWCTAFMV